MANDTTNLTGAANTATANRVDNLDKLRQQVYEARSNVARLRREFHDKPEQSDNSALPGTLLEELKEAEKTYFQFEQEFQKQQRQLLEQPTASHLPKSAAESLILDTVKKTKLLGAATTGLETQIHLRMAPLPTSISHLIDPEETPLFTCLVDNVSDQTRCIRVSSCIEGYSARSTQTCEIPKQGNYIFKQLPTLFPDRVRQVTELTRATLNVTVEDLDGTLEVEQTKPIWLLARTTVPIAVRDPKTGEWQDMTHYLGAFVTPNEPSLMTFLRTAAAHHKEKRLLGYQGQRDGVEPQVEAIFNALKTEAGITYVNSVIAFSPEDGAANQRVRLPRESLADRQANCIDGTVLFASLLEAASLNPAVVVIPQHAFLAWETWSGSNEWRYLETTMTGSHTFLEARQVGENRAAIYQPFASKSPPSAFRRWSLRDLRTMRHITPME